MKALKGLLFLSTTVTALINTPCGKRLKEERQTAAFAVVFEYNVPKIVSNSVCAAACSSQASCKGFENHPTSCALVTSYGTGSFFRANLDQQHHQNLSWY